jgi:hypothetical protein
MYNGKGKWPTFSIIDKEKVGVNAYYLFYIFPTHIKSFKMKIAIKTRTQIIFKNSKGHLYYIEFVLTFF